MWNELAPIEYEAVRSTTWYDIVRRRRDQDLERQLCQDANDCLRLRPLAWLVRWLAEHRVTWRGRQAERKEWKWSHRSIVL
jgi:hypothetical protein